MDSDSDSKPDSYIVLCRTCLHCTDSDSNPYCLFLHRTGIRVWVCTWVRLRQCKWVLTEILVQLLKSVVWERRKPRYYLKGKLKEIIASNYNIHFYRVTPPPPILIPTQISNATKGCHTPTRYVPNLFQWLQKPLMFSICEHVKPWYWVTELINILVVISIEFDISTKI